MYRIIFEHHPLPDKIIEFQGAWKNSSDIIQTYPGARGTRLFRSYHDPTTKIDFASFRLPISSMAESLASLLSQSAIAK